MGTANLVRKYGGSRPTVAERLGGGRRTAAAPVDKQIDTSHVYQGSEAQTSLDRAMSQAEKLLAAPQGLNQQEIAKVEDIADNGWSKALGGLGSVLEFIDRGRKLVSLGVRDFTGFDENRGEEISLGDYWTVAAGRSGDLVDKLGADVVGRDGHLTMSSMLDGVWSHDEDDSWWDKALRGAVSFAGDVLIDPVTYATFGASAVGARGSVLAARTAVSQAGRTALDRALISKGLAPLGKQAVKEGAETGLEKQLARNIAEQGDILAEKMLKEAAKKGKRVSRKPTVPLTKEEVEAVTTQAYKRAAGLDFVGDASPELIESGILKAGADEFVDGVVGKKIQEVGTEIANRNFGSLRNKHQDYIEHVFTRRDGSRLGSAFTVGGMRAGLPFGVKFQSRPLPFTQGAFENMFGLKQLHKIPQSKAGQAVARVTPFVDAQAPFIQSYRRGKSAPSGLTGPQMDWTQRVTAAAAHKVRNDVGLTAAFQQADQLWTNMRRAGLPDDESAAVWQLLFPSVQTGNFSSEALNLLDDAGKQAFKNTTTMLHAVLAHSYDTIRAFSPNMGKIDNYVPLMFSDDFIRMMKKVRERGAFYSGDDLAGEAARLSRVSGEEITTEDLALFMEAYESLTYAAPGAVRVGEAAPIRRRIMGRYLKQVDPALESRMAMWDPSDADALDALEALAETGPKFSTQDELGESLMRTLRALDADPDTVVPLKITDETTAFITDPVKLLNNYVQEIAGVAEQRAFLEANKVLGVAKRTPHAINVDHVMHLIGSTNTETRRLVEAMIDNNQKVIDDYLSAPHGTVQVKYGKWGTQPVDARIAKDPRMKKVIRKVEKKFAQMERQQRQFQRAREIRLKAIQRKHGEGQFAQLLDVASDVELEALRTEYREAIDTIYDDLYDEVRRLWFEVARDGKASQEAIVEASQQASYLAKKAKGTWKQIEAQYLDQIKETTDPVQSWRHLILDPSDQVEYAEKLDALLAPVQARMRARRDGLADRLDELFNERQQAKNELWDKRAEKVAAGDKAAGKKGKDKNALHAKPEEGQVIKGLDARIEALDNDMRMISETADRVRNAKAVDDELWTEASLMINQTVNQQEASALYGRWDRLIRDGIEIRRQMGNTDIARRVEKIWDAFEAGVKRKRGNIGAAGLDQPNVRTVLADAVWDDMNNSKFWMALNDTVDEADMLPQEQWGIHLSKKEILDRIDARIKALNDVELNASHFTVDASADITRDTQLKRLHNDLAMLLGDDPAAAELTYRRYIIDHMMGIPLDHMESGERKVAWMIGQDQIGDSLVASENAFRIVARAPYDPTLAEQLPSAVKEVQRQLRKLPGMDDAVLKYTEDGLRISRSAGWDWKVPFTVREMIDAVADGSISPQALDENGLGFLMGVFPVEAQLRQARKIAARTRSNTVYHMRKAEQSAADFDEMLEVVDNILQGKATAESLRRYVTQGNPFGGGVIPSKKYKGIKDVLPTEKQEQLDRLVEAVMGADSRQTGWGRNLTVGAHEAQWNEMLFRPIEKSMGEVQALSERLARKAAEETLAGRREFLENARIYLEQLTFVESWGRLKSPKGTALSPFAKRGEVTLEEAIGDLQKFGKNLNSDGPWKALDMVGADLGFTKADIKKLYRGGGVYSSALEQGKQPLSTKGLTAAESFGLGGVVAGYQMDPLVAAVFRNMIDGQKALYAPEGMNQIRHAARVFLDWWRPAATIARPNFHLRNMMSGVANGFLIGVGPKQYAEIIPQYTKFRQALMSADGVLDVESLVGSVDAKWQPLFRAALDQDIMSTGFVRSDISRRAMKGGGRPNLNPIDRDKFVLFRAGGKTMEAMEDVLRLSSFAKFFDPDYAVDSAAFARQMTMMVHFDYQDLTMLERRFKTVAPFFVWTRRNVPLQLRAIVEKPGYAQVFHHMSQAMNDNFGTEEYFNSPLPDFYGSLAAPLGFDLDSDDETWARFVFDPDLPLGNLEDLPLFARDEDSALPFSSKSLSPGAWLNYAAQLMGPQLAIPIDWMVAEEDGDYKTNAPTGMNEFGLLMENFDDLFGTDFFDADGQDWRITGMQSSLLNTMVPFYKDFTGGIENNPTRFGRFGGDDDMSVAERLKAEVMGLVGGGVGVKTQTPADAKAASWASKEQMDAMIRGQREGLADNPLAVNS